MDPVAKPFWQSKTMLLNFIGAVLGVAAFFTDKGGPINAFLSANAPMIAMVWSGLGMALRLITKDKVVLSE